LLHSRVISEGGVFHPELASLAIKQFHGDTLEAAFALRAYRSTVPRLVETPLMDTSRMRITRRISAAFKDIPKGQMLGATTDYQLRLMRMDLLDESPEAFRAVAKKWLCNTKEVDIPDTFPKVLDELRKQGLLHSEAESHILEEPFDITRQPLVFPVPRSAALATMARAEQGSLLAMAYSNMRGYGDVHPTVAELRVGYVPVMLPHPITGELTEIGEIEVTECEVVAMYEDAEDVQQQNSKAMFTLGYGACFGHNEVKAVSMAILDRALQKGMKDGPSNPSEDPEFVLLHIDGVDSMGFCSHYKMPHYVTFQSDMDRLRTTQNKQKEAKE
jgi:alpha-D-ribose 1-methylphosphonate 5-triphosphate synthase subunit PhnI